MSENNYTKGEWSIGDIYQDEVVVVKNSPDCEGQSVVVAKPNYHLKEYKANLNLMTAAPDLLEACKELLKEVVVFNKDIYPGGFEEKIKMAKKAIAKAGGETVNKQPVK